MTPEIRVNFRRRLFVVGREGMEVWHKHLNLMQVLI